jgi:hypothetical protein
MTFLRYRGVKIFVFAKKNIMKTNSNLNEQQITKLISAMEQNAENAPILELTLTNWLIEFGETGLVQTPIGIVKMGENQYNKIIRRGREKEFGMIKPTLTNPDVIVEMSSFAKEGEITERASSLIFVKTFNYGTRRVKFYTSVTVCRTGLEVVISNHIGNLPRVRGFLKNGNLQYQRADLAPGADVSDLTSTGANCQNV